MHVLVPSTGNLYIYLLMTCLPMAQALVLVPSTGNLYIYAASKIVMRYFDYVLVPSTGNLYIYDKELPIIDGQIMFSSPPRGIYISTRSKDALIELLNKFSSPPRGIYISTRIPENLNIYKHLFSSPPRGIYISTISNTPHINRSVVLVPSTGNLYIYCNAMILQAAILQSCSRPLHGESIYLQAFTAITSLIQVLVPSTGNLYIYEDNLDNGKIVKAFSSPPRGIYISTVYGLPRTHKKSLFSSPPRGIYISTQYRRSELSEMFRGSRPLHGESIYLRTK